MQKQIHTWQHLLIKPMTYRLIWFLPQAVEEITK